MTRLRQGWVSRLRGCLAVIIGFVALIIVVGVLPEGTNQGAAPMVTFFVVAIGIYVALSPPRTRIRRPSQPVATPAKRQPLPPGLRFKILQRDRYTCRLCGRAQSDGVKLEVDHKIPVAKGGTNDPSNLWTLCWDCNRGKSDRSL